MQSVALSILCEREKEIEDFVPQDYWNIFVDASSHDGRTYRLHVEREKEVSLISEGKTLAINSLAKVRRIEKVLKNEPLTVTAFSSLRNRLLGWKVMF